MFLPRIRPLLLAAAVASTVALLPALARDAQAQSVATAPPPTQVLPDFADLAERAGPAVVNIRTTAKARGGRGGAPQMPDIDPNDPFFEFFRRFFPPGQQPGPGQTPRGPQGREESVPRGVGSGFVISADGFILTNHHVVEGADTIIVTTTDKRELSGKLIGSDQRTDVALVKVEGKGLTTLKIGDPQRLRVGEWVVAIGSPFGLDNTVTAGIVSAKGRDTGDYLPFIQTDVAVNPGNSGGPLINMRGEVIGINSQIYSRTGGFMGISFAIPIDEAMRVTDQLRTTGRVVRGRIGVGIAEVTKEVAEPLGLPKASGALVRNVEPGGPAEKAGVEVGDIIQKFDGRDIERSSDLPRIVGNTKPGSQVAMAVWRRGAVRSLNIAVGEMSTERASADPAAQEPPVVASGASNWLGIVASALGDDRRQQLRVKAGVLVEAVNEDSPAGRAGIRAGDVILQINNQDVTAPQQFNDAVSKLDKSKNLVVLVRRGDAAQYVPIRP
jgi:serine protease Do